MRLAPQIRLNGVQLCAALVATYCAAPVGMLRAEGGATLQLINAQGESLDPARDALQVSRSVTNDTRVAMGTDPADIRIELRDPSAADEAWVWLESIDPTTNQLRSTLRLALRRTRDASVLRSAPVRLVGDDVDLHAPGTQTQTLLVTLRGLVRARYETPNGEIASMLRVGRPGRENGPLAARQARMVIHILRMREGGPAVIGADVDDALRMVRAQVRVVNGIWLQCGVTLGEPSELAVEVVNPPPPSLLSIGDGDGLPARGDGSLRLHVDGRVIGPIATQAGATPLRSAQTLGDAIRGAGFHVEVTENPKTRFGAGRSADLVVRRRDGSLATLSPDRTVPLSTDTRQTATIGAVDLLDGLREFDNMLAQAGTLEERALVKALADDDPRTIDVFLVNCFSEATRQGEAFIATPGAVIVNTVILDRQGLRHAPLAWTLAHEIGHVLMNDPLHPDNVGPDRPWLLMDADNSRGTVNGPKRLRAEDCARVRDVAARAPHPVLVPFTVHDQDP